MNTLTSIWLIRFLKDWFTSQWLRAEGLVEEDDRKQARKKVGGAIGIRGSGICDSLLVASYACMTFIYGSLWKGEMASEAKIY
ncbi:hypothetical protein Tco_0194344 [Tanacetum coccineum]